MGLGEGLLVALVCIIAIVGMIKTAKGSQDGISRPPTNHDEDLARMRQMKEWDRFDDSKNGKS